MIKYDKLFSIMTAKGITTYTIRKNNIISQGSLYAIKHNKSITMSTIDKLCAVLDCQPGDLLEYVKDE